MRKDLTTLPRSARYVLIACVLLYIALASAILLTKIPLNDEGWFAAPAYNLYANGSMGTPSLDQTGSWLYYDLPGIRFRTYWIMPLHVLSQTAWYNIFGFSLFSLRALSIVWGLVAIFSWLAIIRNLTGRTSVTLVAAALICTDHTFLWSAADGRVDMMCLALGSAGIAAYLLLRERNYDIALLASNTAVAASVFSHPNGILAGLGLAIVIARYDFRRLRVRHVFALAPYVLAAAGWGLYIADDPVQFIGQFRANADARPGLGRWHGFANPLRALYMELLLRYFAHFWFYPMWVEPITPFNLFIIPGYWLGPIAVLCTRPLRCVRGHVTLLLVWITTFVFFWNNGLKLQFYLPYIVPLYLALSSVYIVHLWETKRRTATAAILVPFIFLQLFSTVYTVQLNPYQNHYLPATAFIKEHTKTESVVMGSSTLAFELGYANLVDDARLGYGSAIEPDIIVKDRYYQLFWQVFQAEEPDVARYIQLFLSSRYRPAFNSTRYTIYLRDTARSAPVSRPTVINSPSSR